MDSTDCPHCGSPLLAADRCALCAVDPVIAAVWAAWDAIPVAMFGSEDERALAQTILVREGVFQGLVRARAGGERVDAFVVLCLGNPSIKAIPNHRDILTLWAAPLRERRRARDVARMAADEIEVPPEASREERRIPLNRAIVFQNVQTQKAAVAREMDRHNLGRARALVDELVAYQLRTGAPRYASKSLCDLAMAAQERGLFAFQLDLTEWSTRLVPDDSWSWSQHGKALLNVSRPSDSLDAYTRAVAYGRDIVAGHGRAEALKALGRVDEAIAAYDVSIADHPDDIVALTGRAEALKALGRLDEALAAYDAAGDARPGEVIARNGRAEVLKALGRLDEALASYDEALRVYPDNVVAMTERAEILKALGRVDEAFAAYAAVRHAHPDDAVARNGRACLLAATGRSREALRALPTKALTAWEEWTGQYIRGLIFLRMGQIDRAAGIFDRAVARCPFAAQRDGARTALALAWLRRRDYAAASHVLAQVSVPCLQGQADIFRLHAFGAQRDAARVVEVYARLRLRAPAVAAEVLEELRRRYVDRAQSRHDDAWVIEQEIRLALLAA